MVENSRKSREYLKNRNENWKRDIIWNSATKTTVKKVVPLAQDSSWKSPLTSTWELSGTTRTKLRYVEGKSRVRERRSLNLLPQDLFCFARVKFLLRWRTPEESFSKEGFVNGCAVQSWSPLAGLKTPLHHNQGRKLYLPQVLALELSGKTLTSRDSPTIQLFLVLQLRYCTSLKSGYLSGSFPRMPWRSNW